jgi:EPS-associated MarR family transcriptional regulator
MAARRPATEAFSEGRGGARVVSLSVGSSRGFPSASYSTQIAMLKCVQRLNAMQNTFHPSVGHAHLALMRLLLKQPDASQRELAQALGFSLGKTHYLLRALVAKGWIKAQNFGRSNNKAAYSYLLTSSGVIEKFALTRQFLRDKQIEFDLLQQEIKTLQAELDISE